MALASYFWGEIELDAQVPVVPGDLCEVLEVLIGELTLVEGDLVLRCKDSEVRPPHLPWPRSIY